MHMKVLELKAIFLAFKTFIKIKTEFMKTMLDNNTTISSWEPQTLWTAIIRLWDIEVAYQKNNNHLTAAHIPGKQKYSR